MFPPRRIVCLTEETTETLYLLGEEHRIVGISGYTVRPARARKEKPRVSAFLSADIPKILALKPDLVLAFSDLQADIVSGLIREGISVHAFNQRSIAEILGMIGTLGALVGASEKAGKLVRELETHLNRIRIEAAKNSRRPRVYFEEWDEPMISGIQWVSELVRIAGGDDIFPELAEKKGAKDRIVTAADVAARAPDLIIASWCGKKFSAEKMKKRSGLETVPAIRNGKLFEVKSPLILQPGPAALTDGVAAIATIIAANA